MSFDSESDEDYTMYDEDLQKLKPIVKAKKRWKKLFDIVMDKRTDIPLKQMALKAKHENVLMGKM